MAGGKKKGLAGLGLEIGGGAAMNTWPWAAAAGMVVGAGLLLWSVVDWYNDRREAKGLSRLKLEPIHLIWVGMIGTILSALILGGGAIWQMNRVPQASTLPVAAKEEGNSTLVGKTENGAVRDMSLPFKQTIFDFLAKNGHAGGYKPELIQVMDDANGLEYIRLWDQSLWPWPSKNQATGFTSYQLHMLPDVYPALKIPSAKEKLAKALGQLSDFINGPLEKMTAAAQELRRTAAPQTRMEFGKGFWTPRAQAGEEILMMSKEVDSYFREQRFLKDNALVKAEIEGTLPTTAEILKQLEDFRTAVGSYRDFSNMMDFADAQPDQDRAAFIEKTARVFIPIYQAMTNAEVQMRAVITDANRRIDMMMRAL